MIWQKLLLILNLVRADSPNLGSKSRSVLVLHPSQPDMIQPEDMNFLMKNIRMLINELRNQTEGLIIEKQQEIEGSGNFWHINGSAMYYPAGITPLTI